MKRLIASSLLATACGLSAAASTPAPVRAEIDALLARLQASGCEFNRNGSWHDGSEAKGHLLRKLDYLEGEKTLQSTEQFIELAASTSSMSGKPYQVQCGGAASVPSQQWLMRELQAVRKALQQSLTSPSGL
ncbi:MAG TPA: DUF5329 domain-containing protein [Ideonella sp.]|jgi:hypothetical protein|nr:DUF5329 domain-containing protein [Ideonella sp.]